MYIGIAIIACATLWPTFNQPWVDFKQKVNVFAISTKIEYGVSILPQVAIVIAIFQILYRAAWIARADLGHYDPDPFGPQGCKPQLIMLSSSILFYPLLTYLLLKWYKR